MKKQNRDRVSFVDALDGRHAYAVLTKNGRVQILVQPTKKQLRKRGKRNWQLFDTVAETPEAAETLVQTVRQALQSLHGDGAATEEAPPKRKRAEQ